MSVHSPTRLKAGLSLTLMAALAVFSAASAQAGEVQQVTIDEQELAARIRAEVDRALEELRINLADVAGREEMMQRLAEDQARAMELTRSRIHEQMQRAQEMAQRARRQARVRVDRLGDLHLFRDCDEYGLEVLDHADELELTDAQIEQIRSLQRASRRDSIKRRADIEVAEMDLESLMGDPDVDLAAVRSELEELASLEVDETMAGLRLKQDIRQILAQDQLESLDELHDDRDMIQVWAGPGRSLRIGSC